MAHIRKIVPGYLVLISTLISPAFANSNAGQPVRKIYELKTSEATLRIDEKGELRIFTTRSGVITVNSEIKSLWSVVIKNTNTGNAHTISEQKDIEISQQENRIFLKQKFLDLKNERIPVEATFTVSIAEDAFCFTGELLAGSDKWQIRELSYPILAKVSTGKEKTMIYWPRRGGERFEAPVAFGSRSFEYPSMNGSLPWYTITTPTHGVYLGVHDPERGAKKFSLQYSQENNSFGTNITFPVYSTGFKVPPVMLDVYKGEWYTAASFYRRWFDKHFKFPEIPEWLRLNSGLMLFIFKQQNGDLMWKYSDIDKLCDIGDKLNIKLIGIWGRGPGGHDALYPNYMPDAVMGGTPELKKAIRRAQERGFKVIVYTNGTIIDASTDYYRFNGIETVALQEDKRPLMDNYVKNSNTTPVNFAITSPASPLWRQTMIRLAQDAYDLGVDAFYVDQVGVRDPYLDFNNRLDHKLPQEAFTKYRYLMMDELNSYMKKLNPSYGLMTEGTVDAILPTVDIIHNVASVTPNSFPDMFRYSFPESLELQLNSTPALSRAMVNFNMINGFRHLIHSRYSPDVKYLEKGIVPTAADYGELHINYPPPLWTMKQATPEETFSYAHRVIEFENKHERFFRRGKFISSEGITCKGDDVEAKGFLAGDQLGVVVWNKNPAEERVFDVTVQGYRLTEAYQPEKQLRDDTKKIAANSVKFLVFEKVK